MISLGQVEVTATGSVTLRVPVDAPAFMLLPQLTRGVGSSAVHLDRGQPGSMRHVVWVREGAVMALVQLNTHRISTGEQSDAVSDSFATSTLFQTTILDDGRDGALIDVTELVRRDLLGIRRWFALAGAGSATLDRQRSRVRISECRAHAHGIEFGADLTFVGAAGPASDAVSPEPDAITVTQRLTMMPLPTVAMSGRRYTATSGAYGKRFTDFSLPADGSQETGWMPRFRLDPTSTEGRGTEPRTAVTRPIVFSVDPDIPEPWRTAVVEGANWWSEGFDAAGFLDAFRAEVRSHETDPAAAGVNPVWWVHRHGRGWSMGAALTDPRSGEILKGNVRLGSQRVQQVTQLGEALLTPYGREDETERRDAIREMVLARIRQLAAHEVGHALGFMHNYSSHRHATASVMDYPHPQIRLGDDGEIDITRAYPAGLSDWDVFAVRASYEVAVDGDDSAHVQRLRAESDPNELTYLTDDDGHGAAASAPGAVPWIFGADAFAALDDVLAVRAVALDRFGPGAVPRGAQTGELESRFALVHLLHRYHLVAVARLLGGVDHGYGDAHDPHNFPVPVPAPVQRRALDAITGLLDPGVLEVPSRIVGVIAPPSIRFARSGADFGGSMGPVFDPLAAAGAAAALVSAQLFDPARLNRATMQHAQDPECPRPEDYVTRAFAAVSPGEGQEVSDVVAEVARSVLVRSVITSLRSGALHAPCEAIIRRALVAVAEGLPVVERETILSLLSDSSRAFPWKEPVIPDGVPI